MSTSHSSVPAAVPVSHLGVHLRLIGMAVLWGGSWPAGRMLAQALPPITGAALRFTLAVFLFALWLFWARGGLPRITRQQWIALAIAGAVGVFGYAVFFMLGLQRVPASRASLVVTVNPVFTTLFAAWLFAERFNWKIAVGMLCAATGAAVVLTHGEPWKLFVGQIGLGEWFLLGCVATWTAYTLLGKKLLLGIDALTSTAYSAMLGCVMLWVLALSWEGAGTLTHMQTWPLSIWGALVFLALGATLLAYAWYFDGVAKLGAGQAASYISLVPVFGVLSAAWVLGERLDVSLMVGGAMAVAGVVIMNHARRTLK